MKFFYALGFFVSSYFFYNKYKKPKSNNLLVVHSNSKLAKIFKMITDVFLENYANTMYLTSGHAQTFLLELLDYIFKFFKNFFRYYKFKYSRETFELSDGGKIMVDHAKLKSDYAKDKSKILVIVPGFTSNANEYYVKDFLEEFVEEFDCRVMNARGFGGIKLTSPMMISTYCSRDVREYLESVSFNNPDKKIFAVGFSFGGMLLARCLGTNPETLPQNIIGACGICYPSCLDATSKYVESKLGGLYSKYASMNLRKCFMENLDCIFNEKHPMSMGIIAEKEIIIKDVNNLLKVADFDHIYTHKILGFKNIQDYYEDCKIDKFLENINIPFLSVFTQDDPIIPYDAVPLKLLQSNKNLITIISKTGGHMGFFSGFIPKRWIDIPIRTFFKTVDIIFEVKDKKEGWSDDQISIDCL